MYNKNEMKEDTGGAEAVSQTINSYGAVRVVCTYVEIIDKKKNK